MAWLELRGLAKRFGEAVACEQVDLALGRGEFLTLLGASGCGKSTILRMIAGLERPDSGTIVLDQRVLNEVPAHRREAAMVFQSYALFPHLTVAQNVAFGLEARGTARSLATAKVEAALRTVELADYASRYPRQLSGGQQQRVAIARAIVTEPKLLLLDEPLSNLDAKLRDRLRIELRTLQQRLALTTIYVTHDQAEAMSLSDRVAFMAHGRILEIGPPEEIYRRPLRRATAEFVGEANLIPGTIVACAAGGYEAHTSLGPVRVSGSTPPQGGEVLVFMRPEDVSLSAPAGDGLKGRVIHVAFLGAMTDYVVLPDAASTPLRIQVPGLAAAARGDAVTIRLPASAPIIPLDVS